MIGVRCEVPDHSAGSRPGGQAVALALHVDQSDDHAVLLRYQFDRISFVALFFTLDGVEERGVEERQQPADQPTTLVSLLIRTDHEVHSAIVTPSAAALPFSKVAGRESQTSSGERTLAQAG